MALLLAITVGALYACGVYLLLQRSLVTLVIGLVILGHAANLLIMAAAGVTPAASAAKTVRSVR